MTIDWGNFTPWASLAGGLLIGLAASILLLGNGRIAGISGILGGLFSRQIEGGGERLAFLAGLLLAPLLWGVFAALPAVEFQGGWLSLALAGVVVGIGTRYGAGCTSGHGVCGIARLAPRSLAATGLFMAAGFATVYVLRHLLGV